jgi:hypothetical protein
MIQHSELLKIARSLPFLVEETMHVLNMDKFTIFNTSDNDLRAIIDCACKSHNNSFSDFIGIIRSAVALSSLDYDIRSHTKMTAV